MILEAIDGTMTAQVYEDILKRRLLRNFPAQTLIQSRELSLTVVTGSSFNKMELKSTRPMMY